MTSPSIKSATRVIEVLEFFCAETRPHSLKEISDKLRYPQSSTSVLMKNLMSLGYLNYDAARRVYFPTLQVTRLGAWIPKALFGHGEILEIMNKIHAITGETVAIGILNDVYVQYIKVILSTHAIRFHVEEGSMRVVTRTPAGWMLLALKTDAEIDKIVRRANITVRDVNERASIGEFIKAIRRVRRDKYAYAEHIPLLGAAAVCITLPVTLQGQPVVLGIGGVADRIRPRLAEYVGLLRESATALGPDDAHHSRDA